MRDNAPLRPLRGFRLVLVSSYLTSKKELLTWKSKTESLN